MIEGCRWLISLGSRIVPENRRERWRGRWEGVLRDWRILTDRGEVTLRDTTELARDCWGAVKEAVWLRFSREQARRFVRGPAFVLVVAALLIAAGAIATDGYAATRSVVQLAKDIRMHPSTGPHYDPRSDRLFAAIIPLVFGLAAGIALVFVARVPLRGYGWRYISLLILKVLAILTLGPLVWIEGGRAIRGQIAHEGVRVLVGGLMFALVYIASFACGMWWAIQDQRKRCPVCLHRLAMPVRIGSWGSVFDPPATELLCYEGHGAMCISESGGTEEEHWAPMDESWRELFEHPAK